MCVNLKNHVTLLPSPQGLSTVSWHLWRQQKAIIIRHKNKIDQNWLSWRSCCRMAHCGSMWLQDGAARVFGFLVQCLRANRTNHEPLEQMASRSRVQLGSPLSKPAMFVQLMFILDFIHYLLKLHFVAKDEFFCFWVGHHLIGARAELTHQLCCRHPGAELFRRTGRHRAQGQNRRVATAEPKTQRFLRIGARRIDKKIWKKCDLFSSLIFDVYRCLFFAMLRHISCSLV